MTILGNFDLRQIRLMKKKLLLFESKKIDLFELIKELNTILNALEKISDSWIADFQSKINFLELIHDSIENGSISRWKGSFKEDLDKTISGLKKMVSILLDEYLKIPDSRVTEIAIEGDSKWLICPHCNDAWESVSFDAMVICPKCEHVCQNPRSKLNE
jgi:hypothetical protein